MRFVVFGKESMSMQHVPSQCIVPLSPLRLTALLSEYTTNFYRDSVRHTKAKIDRRAYSAGELTVRYYFKVRARGQ